MTPKFEVYQDKRGDYRWRLLDSHGDILAVSSQGYNRKAAAVHGLGLVRQTNIASRSEVFEDKAGRFRWRQVATNGRILATGGESYPDHDEAAAAMGWAHALAPQAPVEDLTQDAVVLESMV